jgi:hypothetical protein
MTSSSYASEIGVMIGGQAMDQFDKAATVIVHHQPRQRSFAGAGRFLTEIIAHIWRCAQFETHIVQKVSASFALPERKGKHNV